MITNEMRFSWPHGGKFYCCHLVQITKLESTWLEVRDIEPKPEDYDNHSKLAFYTSKNFWLAIDGN